MILLRKQLHIKIKKGILLVSIWKLEGHCHVVRCKSNSVALKCLHTKLWLSTEIMAGIVEWPASGKSLYLPLLIQILYSLYSIISFLFFCFPAQKPNEYYRTVLDKRPKFNTVKCFWSLEYRGSIMKCHRLKNSPKIKVPMAVLALLYCAFYVWWVSFTL